MTAPKPEPPEIVYGVKAIVACPVLCAGSVQVSVCVCVLGVRAGSFM